MRVLVVEDHRAMREIVIGHLRDRGFAVDGVECADEALAAAPAIDCDALILDLGLPDADGMETRRQLRSRDSGLPTLVLPACASLIPCGGQLHGNQDRPTRGLGLEPGQLGAAGPSSE
jgi:two-component system response regulator QseB